MVESAPKRSPKKAPLTKKHAHRTDEKKRRNPKIPPKETRWKKGQSGNPKGRAVESPARRQLRTMGKAEILNFGTLVMRGNMSHLQAIVKDPKAPVIQIMFAAVCASIIKKGDMNALQELLNRIVGPVPKEMQLTGEPLGNVQVLVSLPSNGREVTA